MPRLVDHDVRRRELALAVWGIIAERGIEGVTLRAVAREAGVSVGRVQHYYATREELVRDSCRVMLDLAGESFDAQTGAPGPAESLRALVLHAIPTTEGFTQGTAVWTTYLAKSVDDEGIAALLRGSHTDVLDLAARWVEDAREAGELQASPPGLPARDLALELLALADGYAARVLAGSLTADDALAALGRRLAIELP